MPDDNEQQSNHDRMMTQLREAYEAIVLTNPELADNWKENPSNSELPDPDLEEDFDYTPGAYDDWEPQDTWEDDEDEDNKDNPFLIEKAEDIKFSTKIIAFNNLGKFLILEDAWTKDKENFWDLPGGHVEDGETPDDGLVREVREEVGLELKNFSPELTTELKLGEAAKPVLFYVGEAVGEPKLSEEHTSYKWVTLEESEDYNLGVFHDVIEEIFEGGYPGGIITFPLKKDLLQSLNLNGYEDTLENGHVTLAYVKYNELPHDLWYKAVNEIVQGFGPPPCMEGEISGTTIFHPSENSEEANVVVALVNISGLKEWQASLVKILEAEGFEINETHKFNPHITLEFIENTADIPELNIPKQAIKFSEIEIWTNNEQHTVNFVNDRGEKVKNE